MVGALVTRLGRTEHDLEVAHQLTLTHEGVEGSGAQRHLGSALLLVGEPGIGQTALPDHAASRAQGTQLLRARRIRVRGTDPVHLAVRA